MNAWWPFFVAFDLLAVEGEDLRALPVLARKRRLRPIMPRIQSRLGFMEQIERRGVGVFRAACNGATRARNTLARPRNARDAAVAWQLRLSSPLRLELSCEGEAQSR